MKTYYEHQLETKVETKKSLLLAAKHISSSNFLQNWNVDYVWYVLAASQKVGCYSEINGLISHIISATKEERELMAMDELKRQGIQLIRGVDGKMVRIQPRLDLKINW